MDGLECSEIRKSELEFSGRIDAEYYQKQYLLFEQMVRKNDYHRMAEICHFLIGPFGSAYDTSNYVDESKYRYIRGQDVKPFFVQEMSPRFMAEQDFLRLQKYALKENDLLVSVVGTLGNACIIQAKELPAIFSCKSTAVRADSVDPYYLLAYTNSKYGRKLLLRKERGAIQKGLNLDDLKTFEVPSFSDVFQQEIAWLIQKAQQLKTSSQSLYRNAERVLDEQLNVQINDQRSPVSSVKYLSESFLSSGRLDAEYYQPKYESIANELNTSEKVASLCSIYDDTFIPATDTEYRYIELSNVGHYGDVSGVESVAGEDLPSRARRKVATGEVIISSVEGSLQSCALIDDEFDGALCSTGFYVLDSDEINSETLLVLFKSEPIQALMKQRCSGTILTAISKDELLSMPLPKINTDVQKTVAEKVRESFVLRRKSKELLEYAKQAVEMAIEQGEDAALEWLKDRGVMS